MCDIMINGEIEEIMLERIEDTFQTKTIICQA
jgi:hypothetical protein